MESYFNPMRISTLSASSCNIDKSIGLQGALNYFIHASPMLSMRSLYERSILSMKSLFC
jgi:hypothetical protein